MNDAIFDDAESTGPDGRGWFRVHRKIINSEVFACPHLLRIFVWLMASVVFRPTWTSASTGRGVKQVLMQPGQTIVGRHRAAAELSLPASTFWERLKKLEAMGCLKIASDTHYSIVYIVNWRLYQAEDVARPTPNRHVTDTQPTLIKNVKNAKKDSAGAESPASSLGSSLVPTPSELLAVWNATPGTIKARVVRGTREKIARARLSDPEWTWREALAKFPLRLCQSDPGGWQPDLDWFLRPESVNRILEGKYDWEKANGHRPEPTSPARIHSPDPDERPLVIRRATDFAVSG